MQKPFLVTPDLRPSKLLDLLVHKYIIPKGLSAYFSIDFYFNTYSWLKGKHTKATRHLDTFYFTNVYIKLYHRILMCNMHQGTDLRSIC